MVGVTLAMFQHLFWRLCQLSSQAYIHLLLFSVIKTKKKEGLPCQHAYLTHITSHLYIKPTSWCIKNRTHVSETVRLTHYRRSRLYSFLHFCICTLNRPNSCWTCFKDKTWHLTTRFHWPTNLNNFRSLEVVDRVDETQLQVGENSN